MLQIPPSTSAFSLKRRSPSPGTQKNELLSENSSPHEKDTTFARKRAGDLAQGRLLGATNGAEALLELVDTTLGIHELVLTGEEGVRVGGDTAGNHIVLYTIDNLSLSGGSGGASDEAAARGDVHEHYRIVLGMQISFHSLTGCVTVAARSNYTLPLTLVKLYLNFRRIFLVPCGIKVTDYYSSSER